MTLKDQIWSRSETSFWIVFRQVEEVNEKLGKLTARQTTRFIVA